MNKSKNLRSYFISFFTGAILVLLSLFMGFGMYTISSNGFDLSTIDEFNYSIIRYSYNFNSLVFILFGYSSLLTPLFFAILGIKKILSIKTNFFLLHFFALIISLIFIDFILSSFKLNGGLLGDTVVKFLTNYNILLFENKLYFSIMIFIILNIVIMGLTGNF